MRQQAAWLHAHAGSPPPPPPPPLPVPLFFFLVLTRADNNLVLRQCRKLKKRAAAVLEDTLWQDVYHLWVLRNATGSVGWLYHTFGEPWKVYHSPDKDEGSECGQLVKIFSKSWSAGAQHLRPESTDVAKALSEGTERHGESEYGGRTTWW